MIGPGDILPSAAARFADKIALVCTDRSFSYAELNRMSDGLAAGIVELGVRQGQTISLLSQNRWEWLVTYHAALKAGAVVNPVNVMLTPDELEYAFRDCESAMLFAGASQAASVMPIRDRLPHLKTVVDFDSQTTGAVDFAALLSTQTAHIAFTPEADGVCTIGYTSGTTGHPKGAMQSHRAVLYNCTATATMHCKTSDDVIVSALPAPHVYGNVAINGTWLAGGTVVLMERFDPAEAMRLVEAHRATMIEGVPAMYAMMLDHPDLVIRDISSLTRCTVGGQTISTSVMERWESASDAPLIELWGMTEISGLGATHLPHVVRPSGSIGVTLPGVESRIIDLDDPTRDAQAGTPGELAIRGPIVMLGYYRAHDATSQAIDANGWLRTGDIATKDASGNLYIVDRLKDLIITGGYNIYPAEIERVLASHEAVALVAVGALPDSVKGELACAYIVRAQGTSCTEQELREFCETRLAAYKRPKEFRFVTSLPLTSSGKIMRRNLREHCVETE